MYVHCTVRRILHSWPLHYNWPLHPHDTPPPVSRPPYAPYQLTQEWSQIHTVTINVPVVYLAAWYVMILLGEKSFLGPLEGVGPENWDFFGPWNGNERSPNKSSHILYTTGKLIVKKAFLGWIAVALSSTPKRGTFSLCYAWLGIAWESTCTTEGVFLDVIWTEILRLLLFTVTNTSIFYSPPMVFFDLRFVQQQLKVGGGLAFCTLSLC